jgi:hypothetical protein
MSNHGTIESKVSFALIEHIHLLLAHGNIVSILLETSYQELRVAHARILLNLMLLSHLLSLTIFSWSILRLLLHLHLLLLFRCVTWLSSLLPSMGSTAHDSSHSLVTNSRTSTKCSSSHEHASKATTAPKHRLLRRRLLHGSLLLMMHDRGSCSWHARSCRAAA